MNFAELLPVLDVALAPSSRHDTDSIEEALRQHGWTLAHTETEGERRWRAPDPPAPDIVPAAAWTVEVPDRGVSFGLLVATATDAEAEKLRAELQTRIDAGDAVRTSESDEVWTSWSDGVRAVRLALHRSSRLSGRSVQPSVQLSLEPAGSAPNG